MVAHYRRESTREQAEKGYNLEGQKVNILKKHVSLFGNEPYRDYCEMKTPKMIQFENMNPPRKG